MAKVVWTLEETDEVIRRAGEEAEESARVATAAFLYLVAACCIVAGTWILVSMTQRVVKSVWHYYKVRRPIERAKKQE